MMSYANLDFTQDLDRNHNFETSAFEADEFETRKKAYVRGRSYRPARRRSARKSSQRASQPGCGIAARRNRRYAW